MVKITKQTVFLSLFSENKALKIQLARIKSETSFEFFSCSHYQNCDAYRDFVPLVQFKNVKNTHGELLLLVKLKASTCNFTRSNTPPWAFFTFLNCTNSTKSCDAS